MVVEARMHITLHDRTLDWEEGNGLSFLRVWIINPSVMNTTRYCRLNRREP